MDYIPGGPTSSTRVGFSTPHSIGGQPIPDDYAQSGIDKSYEILAYSASLAPARSNGINYTKGTYSFESYDPITGAFGDYGSWTPQEYFEFLVDAGLAGDEETTWSGLGISLDDPNVIYNDDDYQSDEVYQYDVDFEGWFDSDEDSQESSGSESDDDSWYSDDYYDSMFTDDIDSLFD